MNKTTKAFVQAVGASLVASVMLEGVKSLGRSAGEAAEDGALGELEEPLATLPWLEDLAAWERLAVVAVAALLLALLLFLALRRAGMKVAAFVLPILAVAVTVAVYALLVF